MNQSLLLFLRHTVTDLPQARESWAQASDSLAPPAGQHCLCRLPSAPLATGQILHTYSDMHCRSLVARSQTTPPQPQIPEPGCKLQGRVTERRNKKNWACKYMWCVRSHSVTKIMLFLIMQHLCCEYNSDPDKQIQPPKRPVQQQWGSCWQNRCGLCETRQLNPDWGCHHYVFSSLIGALHTKRQRCWQLLSTRLHR